MIKWTPSIVGFLCCRKCLKSTYESFFGIGVNRQLYKRYYITRLYKKAFLKHSLKFTGKHLCCILFLIKLQSWWHKGQQHYWKESLSQVFSCEFWKNFQERFLAKHFLAIRYDVAIFFLFSRSMMFAAYKKCICWSNYKLGILNREPIRPCISDVIEGMRWVQYHPPRQKTCPFKLT